MVPTFTAHRSTREAPTCYPGSIATTTPQTFTVASGPDAICRARSRPSTNATVVHCMPAHDPPGSEPVHRLRDVFDGSFRTPSRLASRTRTIWQYWHVPSLSGLLPPSPASPGSGCPQLHPAAATARRCRSLTSTR